MESYQQERRREFENLSQMAGSWAFCFAIARGLSDAGAGYTTFGVLIAGSIFLFLFWAHKAERWNRHHIELNQLAEKRREEEQQRK